MNPQSKPRVASRRRALGLSLAFALALGCSPLQTDGDFMFLRNEGADLPVWVRGNTGSGTFLVWLASGPGDPVSIVRGAATAELERHYGIVYWDQRGAGSAQGNPSPATFTMAQFVDDTDEVVELVRHRYGARRIFLLGHSWGGTLGTAYLLDQRRQQKIAGWIDVDGNHDMPLVFPMKLAWLEAYARERADSGSQREHWATVRDFCASHPPLTEANFKRWEAYAEGTNAEFHDPRHGIEVGFDEVFRSPDSPLAYLFVNRRLDDAYLFHDDGVRRSFSYSDAMSAIRLPTLLLWGEHDGIVPLPAAFAARASLGTPPEALTLVRLTASAHFPFLEEPAAFAAAVVGFVDARR